MPQSRPPELPQPLHPTLVTRKQPRGESLAHSALLRRQAKPARLHSPLPVLCLLLARHVSDRLPLGPRASTGALCAYGNIICTVYYSQCILTPLSKGVWVYIHASIKKIFTYQMCLCLNIAVCQSLNKPYADTSMSLLKLVLGLERPSFPLLPMDIPSTYEDF